VATPFPKFFNFGEGGYALPEGEFEAFEKLDGSLIIVFHHGGRWWAVTKGDFHATQAAWALNVLTANPAVAHLDTSKTWLFEAVGPQNRIVVPYGEPALVLLAAFDHQGVELAYGTVQEVAEQIGVRAAERHHFARLADLVGYADGLPRTREGFVVRYRNGTRLKIKGAEYRRIHALISRVTPLAIWEAMAAGDDLDSFRRDTPWMTPMPPPSPVVGRLPPAWHISATKNSVCRCTKCPLTSDRMCSPCERRLAVRCQTSSEPYCCVAFDQRATFWQATRQATPSPASRTTFKDDALTDFAPL